MAVVFDGSCLYSTMRNISGQTKRFPFLPPHGRELANNAEMTVFGHITDAVTRGDRFGRTNQDALEEALKRDWIQVRSTPSPIFLDEVVSDEVRTIGINNGSVVVNDPCWEASLTV